MKIYSMTATFGKLNHETLTLKPGLNVIQAPNEWGKSTWCAFLINMLYGIETRSRSSSTSLADKEHYAPWSGAPMSGRIELNWEGRDITIERTSPGRTPFGAFRAYETETGLDVPELNGSNCGQQLLGVERSVFQRAGFLRLADLPVTADDALRRRLNNLVTMGDESGAGDRLSGSLRDLKNKCRSNRSTGLIPEAEEEREHLHSQLNELYDLKKLTQQVKDRQQSLATQLGALENHQTALRHSASQQGLRQLEQARTEAQQAQTRWQTLQEQARTAADPQTVVQAQVRARQLQEQILSLQLRRSTLPQEPTEADIPSCYRGMTPQEALVQTQEDLKKLEALQRKKSNALWIALYCIFAALGLTAMVLLNQSLIWILGGAAVGLCGIVLGLCLSAKARKLQSSIHALYDRHPGLSPDHWSSHAEQYAQARESFREKQAAWMAQKEALEQETAALNAQVQAFTQGEALDTFTDRLAQQQALHTQCAQAQEAAQQARHHLEALEAVAQPAPAPLYPDSLTYTREETEQKLNEARFEQHQLQLKLGQYMGQTEALGQEAALRARLDALNRRIARLEDTYYALELAQDALHKASSALQRRFAPRIAKQAQALMSRLTEGRYERLSMAEDLSLNTSAQQEDTLRGTQWRSDGTMDQMYLALRLSVARELTPLAPLILDDALVRFDDRRLEKALEILKEEAAQKQVILFTCQKRETQLL